MNWSWDHNFFSGKSRLLRSATSLWQLLLINYGSLHLRQGCHGYPLILICLLGLPFTVLLTAATYLYSSSPAPLCLWTSLFILQCLYVVGWWLAEQCREDWHWSAFLGNLFLQQSNIPRCFGQSSESCGWVEPSFILQSSPVGCYSGSAGKMRPVILEKSQSSRKKY